MNFLKDKTITISILNVNDLENFLILLKGYNMNNIVIHFDVMDGEFVSEYGVDIELIKLVKKYNFYVDVHLMCSNPKQYIDKAISLGADNITIHYEIDNLYENLKYLKEKNVSVGISIKPETDVKKLYNYIDLCDMILIMSVNPGLGGQAYIESVNNKITEAIKTNKSIQIDGGINDNTIVIPNSLGVKSFVIGSYITKDIDSCFDKIEIIQKIIK